MTTEEQKLADDKVRAEIAHLNSLTAQAILNLEKIATERNKLKNEDRYFFIRFILAPFLAAAALMGATAAIVKLFF